MLKADQIFLELKPESVIFGTLRGSGNFSKVLNIDLCYSSDEEEEDSEKYSMKEIEGYYSEKNINKFLLLKQYSDSSILRNWFLNVYSNNYSRSIRSLDSFQNKILTKDKFSARDFMRKNRAVAKLPRFEYNTKMYNESLKCLQNEAKILSVLSHDHVIKIYGGSSNSNSNSKFKDFILLEELTTTLDKSLDLFRYKMQQRCLDSTYLDRIEILFDLASAFQYVHSKGIIHRDLKPSNVGFNFKGVLKLYDFGLATDICHKSKNWSGLFELEGYIGSPRYMAPEVAKGQNYNEKADVYSFGILMYEVLSLEKPFKGYDIETWLNKINSGERPVVDENWNNSMKSLMINCWSSTIENRPNFNFIVEILRANSCAWS